MTQIGGKYTKIKETTHEKSQKKSKFSVPNS